jgi:hypothetical protein
VFVDDGDGSSCIEGGATPELLIRLFHSKNFTLLSPFGVMSSIPAAVVSFNGARVPVELVFITAITMPFPSTVPIELYNFIQLAIAVCRLLF